MAPPPTHFRTLQMNLVSAEDLAPVSKNMKTYAVVWIKPDEKLATGVDQKGRTDPTWNDRFTFKVDDKFLNSDDAKIVVEIYAAAWIKDALVGSVNVLFNDIFHLRSVTDAETNNSARRTVTLQIRRPSGRPQGILKMEESRDNANAKIKRSQSDRFTELTADEYDGHRYYGPRSSCSAFKGISMVNGESLCNSDVGPSASIVAAAIAKGLYQPPGNDQPHTSETSKISEWTKKEREEELSLKLERWRAEIPPPATASGKRSRKGRRSRKRSGGFKLFSCFGNAFQFEISITCGSKKKHGNGKKSNGDRNAKNKICHLGSVNENNSKSFA
ncbi:putative Plasmodesmata-located protein 2 [Hibiscus syriacus]|uniref:Plasmodesmata-located protein 2 n=1 Tax=Hibiscus syriacus TaxID=106335 RepID=A0A6A2ZBS4_HIBSY|nr:putative Plasmodesmata-located protein 2 [Hibiscus syriacus]